MDAPLDLSRGQFDLVYTGLSFMTASMGAALVFLLVRPKLSERHCTALTISTLVMGIALYPLSALRG